MKTIEAFHPSYLLDSDLIEFVTINGFHLYLRKYMYHDTYFIMVDRLCESGKIERVLSKTSGNYDKIKSDFLSLIKIINDNNIQNIRRWL